MGHVYGSLAVADAVASEVDEVRFSLPEGAETARAKVREWGYGLAPWSHLTTGGMSTVDCVVVDLPQPKPELVTNVAADRTIVYGNPETNVPMAVCEAADWVVTPLDLSDGFTGKTRQVAGAVHLIGPSFLILRDEILCSARTYETDSLERVLLAFGGADPSNLTCDFLVELPGTLDVQVEVVVGPAFDHHERLLSVRQESDGDAIRIHEDTDKMGTLIHRSDLVVTSPGLTMLEAISIGVPTVGVVQNDDQLRAFSDVDFVYEAVGDIEEFLVQSYNETEPPTAAVGSERQHVIDAITGNMQ